MHTKHIKRHHQPVRDLDALTGIELSILCYLFTGYERSDVELLRACGELEPANLQHALEDLAHRGLILRTKKDEVLIEPDCWFITFAGRKCLQHWLEATAPKYRPTLTILNA